METKICTKCKQEKPATIEFFYHNRQVKSGLDARCKICIKEYAQHYRANNQDKIKAWNEAHKEGKVIYNKHYKIHNREKYRELDRKWRAANKEKVRESSKKTRAKHGKRYIKCYIERRRNSPQLRIANSLRGRVREALKGTRKTARTFELLGCDIQMFLEHLENLFQPGMTFSNYGDWHIDHIKPCASFDLTDPAQQQSCFHYTNLQPLWKLDNLKKAAKHPSSSMIEASSKTYGA